MKIYTVKDIHGKRPKEVSFKVDGFGKLKIVSKKELFFEEKKDKIIVLYESKSLLLKKDGTPKKKPGRKAPKVPTVTPPVAIVSEVGAPAIVSTTNGVDAIALPDADMVNVGDSIEFTMNGEPTHGQITKEYPDLQEMEVMIKGGLRVIIPAAWFIRKI